MQVDPQVWMLRERGYRRATALGFGLVLAVVAGALALVGHRLAGASASGGWRMGPLDIRILAILGAGAGVALATWAAISLHQIRRQLRELGLPRARVVSRR